MSDITTERAWLDEQTRRHREFMDTSHRIMELQGKRMLAQLERQNRKVLGFIPGDVAAMWPWLLVVVLCGLSGAAAGTLLLLHVLDPATACRSVEISR